ncbi:hypothetical protein YB2330_005971 [Saitoella coloradoensis]
MDGIHINARQLQSLKMDWNRMLGRLHKAAMDKSYLAYGDTDEISDIMNRLENPRETRTDPGRYILAWNKTKAICHFFEFTKGINNSKSECVYIGWNNIAPTRYWKPRVESTFTAAKVAQGKMESRISSTGDKVISRICPRIEVGPNRYWVKRTKLVQTISADEWGYQNEGGECRHKYYTNLPYSEINHQGVPADKEIVNSGGVAHFDPLPYKTSMKEWKTYHHGFEVDTAMIRCE